MESKSALNPGFTMPVKDLLRLTVGRASNLMLPDTKRFIVLTSGRSGSNLLVSLMNAHRGIRQHGEIFGEYQLGSRSVRRRINHAGAARYLDQRLERMAFELATGVKVLYGNMEARYGCKRGIRGTEELPQRIVADSRLLVVHLVRMDKFATVVSAELADKTRQWLHGSYGDQRIRLSVDWVQCRFEWLAAWEDWVRRAIPASRVLRTTYEELVGNTDSEIGRVFDFLGVPRAEVASPVKRQRRRPKSEVVENFGELRAAFRGTPYAPMFDE